MVYNIRRLMKVDLEIVYALHVMKVKQEGRRRAITKTKYAGG